MALAAHLTGGSTLDGVGGTNTAVLQQDASYDFSTTAVTNVDTITATGATGTKVYTFDAADLNDVTTVTGTNGQAQTVTLNDTDDLSGIDFTDMETLTFGNFAVNIDSGNLTSFATAITGGGTGTLDLNEDVDYDFSNTLLTGVGTITATGATAGKTYTFDAADLNDVTTVTGTNGQAQTVTLNDADDLSGINFTDIETIATGVGGGIGITLTAAQADGITLTATAASDTYTVTGSAGAQTITGSAGNDSIEGGAGVDIMTGGAGTDIFVKHDIANDGADTFNTFTTAADGAGVGAGADQLQFSKADLEAQAGFTAFTGGGGIDIGGGTNVEFVASTGGGLVASGAEAAFLFDTASGELTFDADGTDANAAVAIGTLYSDVATTGIDDLAAGDFDFVA